MIFSWQPRVSSFSGLAWTHLPFRMRPKLASRIIMVWFLPHWALNVSQSQNSRTVPILERKQKKIIISLSGGSVQMLRDVTLQWQKSREVTPRMLEQICWN